MSVPAEARQFIESRKADHFETLENQEHAGRLGMWLFIATEILFFATLFALYFAYRALYREAFAAASTHSDLTIGTINTVVLITSSLTMAMAIHSAKGNAQSRIVRYLGITLLLGLAFAGLKATEYWRHIEEGIGPGNLYTFVGETGPGVRIYFALYYVMTGLHAVHVLIGLTLITALIVRARRGYYHASSSLGLELVGVYWHLVDLIWIFLWPMFYLVH